MDFTVGIISQNLATTSNSETVGIFIFFEAAGGSARHLAHFEWLKRCHVSCAELVKHEPKCGPWVDTWHDVIG